MGKKYLIVMDIDGTLVDSNYRSTSPTIYSVIEQMQEEGHIFVLNSNRSLEDILEIANHFHIKGPVIGENGCFIYNQETEETTVLIPDQILAGLNKLKDNVKDIIAENFSHSEFAISDTTDFNKYYDTQDVPENIDTYFIMNEFRKFSISIHVRKIVNGEPAKDLENTKKLYDLMKDYIITNNLNLSIEYTDRYCNVLVCSKENNKTAAFKELNQSLSGDYVKVIIGDDSLDKPTLDELDYFFVVNNAKDNVKAIADYVAKEEITKGGEEILLKLDELTK